MNYTKPEVVAQGVAVNAIQGSKDVSQTQDQPFEIQTLNAYLADE